MTIKLGAAAVGGALLAAMSAVSARDFDRFSPAVSLRGHRTRRELAAALLFDVAGPDRSKAPATTLML